MTPSCCSLTPVTLTLTWSVNGTVGVNIDPTTGAFDNATVVYGPAPGPNLQGVFGNNWYSTANFDDGNGNRFYYLVQCAVSGAYTVRQAFETSSYASPYYTGVIYQWFITQNTCSPFSMTGGGPNTSYLPSNAAATLTG